MKRADSSRCGAGSALVVSVLVLLAVSLVSCASTMDRSELATEYYNLGSAFFDLGDLERSADYFTRALEFDPSLARASYNLARVYVLQGRLADAESILTGLLEVEPENTVVLETLGYVAYSKGELDVAGTHYDTVIRIDPGSVNALFNRALIASGQDDAELAVELLRRAVEVNDRDAAILGLLSASEEEIGNTDEAIAALVALKGLGEADWSAFLRLAALYEATERYDRSLEELEGVVEGADDPAVKAHAFFARARILLTAAQEPEAGLEALASAFEAGFSDPESIEALRDDPELIAGAEVRDLIDAYGLLAETAPGGGEPVGDSPADTFETSDGPGAEPDAEDAEP